MRILKILLSLCILLLATSCTVKPAPAEEVPPMQQEQPQAVPIKADWSNPAYTAALLDALEKYGQNLLRSKPQDLSKFCYSFASAKQCWVAVISSMSRYESGFDTNQTYKENFKDAKGNYIISVGLLQVSKESCNAYGAGISSSDELKIPANNLRCAVLILNKWVVQDGLISGGQKSAWRGGARYWSVLRTKLLAIQVHSLGLTR